MKPADQAINPGDGLVVLAGERALQLQTVTWNEQQPPSDSMVRAVARSLGRPEVQVREMLERPRSVTLTVRIMPGDWPHVQEAFAAWCRKVIDGEV